MKCFQGKINSIFLIGLLFIAILGCWDVLKIKSGSEQVRFRPQKSLGVPVERFFALLRFEQWGKLDQLGIEIG
jgi:hypothetical protein